MKIQLANVISDLSGSNGQRSCADPCGERNPEELAALRRRYHATRRTIARSLEGAWQPDRLFVWDKEDDEGHYSSGSRCDQELDSIEGLRRQGAHGSEGEQSPTTPRERRRSGPAAAESGRPSAPRFDFGRWFRRISGIDLTRIDGIDIRVAQTVVGEVRLRYDALEARGALRLVARPVSDDGVRRPRAAEGHRRVVDRPPLPCVSQPPPCCGARVTSVPIPDAFAANSAHQGDHRHGP